MQLRESELENKEKVGCEKFKQMEKDLAFRQTELELREKELETKKRADEVESEKRYLKRKRELVSRENEIEKSEV